MNIQKLKSEKTITELLEFGIINIDKPSGPTSFNVSDFVRKKLHLRKTSHFGTLDPKVTGVLPVALNRACKLTGYFIGEDKEYTGIMRMHEPVDKEKIESEIKTKFTGIITQKPPVKSRVKREERQRKIQYFEILEQDKNDFVFRVGCQGGTYIRKLIHDLGESLNIGAHMLELRRTSAGIFSEEDKEYPGVNLYEFEKAIDEFEKGKEDLLRKIIIPAEIVSEVYPEIQIKKQSVKNILTGKPVLESDLSEKETAEKKIAAGEKVSVFSGRKFIGMYKIINSGELFAKPEFVLQPLKNN